MSSGRLGLMPRPRGGDWLEDEIRSLGESKVEALVSLLEASEVAELELEQEEAYCHRLGISFLAFPIADRNVPGSISKTKNFIQALSNLLLQNKSLVIHCRQGIGRSSMIAACVMALQGVSGDEAFARLAEARGCAVPDTEEQRDWVKRFIENF